MINANDVKRNQENTISRTNSFRRPNAIIVAASSDDEEEAGNREGEQQRSVSSRCCGNG